MTNLAHAYREMVKRDIFTYFDGDDAAFHALVRGEYRRAAAGLERAGAGAQRDGFVSTLYFAGLGLLTYGDAEVAETILRCAPPVRNPARRYLGCLDMFPLPEGLEPDQQVEETLAWFEAHRGGFRFDPAQGNFVFREAQPGQGEPRMPFRLTLSGAAPAVLGGLVDADIAGTGAPDRVSNLGTDLPISDWRALATEASPGLRLAWTGGDTPGSLNVELNGVVRADREGVEPAPRALVRLLESIPFDFAVVGDRYLEWEDYQGPIPAPGHCSLGLALAVRGSGHQRLVSGRWLEYGPWLLVRRGELSLVFFHDPHVDHATALAQARPGHRAMGPGPDGGWVHPDFQFSGGQDGLYDPEAREYIRVLMGRDPEPWELLEHAAVRVQQALGPAKPVQRVALVMPEEERARRWIHACWLRGIELRTFVAGTEVSLTDGYEPPPPVPPEWVRRRDWLPDG